MRILAIAVIVIVGGSSGCASTEPKQIVQPADLKVVYGKFKDHPRCTEAIDDHVAKFGDTMWEGKQSESDKKMVQSYDWRIAKKRIRRLRLTIIKGKCSWTSTIRRG